MKRSAASPRLPNAGGLFSWRFNQGLEFFGRLQHAFVAVVGEAERRPRAEKIVAVARRNGNSKREFSATGAWVRDRMIKLLLPLSSKGTDWMYAYDPRAAA
jgi:hypothetical protein